MTKTPAKPIAQPGPTSDRLLDVGPLESILREELRKQRAKPGGSDGRAVMEAAARWRTEEDVEIPAKQAVTVAWRVYRSLDDEQLP